MKLKWGMALAVAIACNSVGAAHAIGWYHMPSNCLQYMGWGFGPGYHAPLVLGPHGIAPTSEQKRIRLQCPPFAVGVGCPDCGNCQSSMHGYHDYRDPSPTDYPRMQNPQTSSVPPPSPVQWHMFGPPASSAVGR